MKNKLILLILIIIPLKHSFSYIELTKPIMTLEIFNSILNQHPEVIELKDIPAFLPGEYRMNFVLKNGILREGERGHLVERIISQSSSPKLPRAI